jgi:hypothetical protein
MAVAQFVVACVQGENLMTSWRKRSPGTLVIRRSVPIEVTPLPFQPLESVRNLDLDRLARVKSARIEIGHYETGCCRRVVRAVIRNGMVTNFELEPCKKPVHMTPEMKGIIRDAHQALRARKAPGQKFPFPVQQLPGAVAKIKYSIWVCVRICCFGYCLTCCIDTTWVSSIWLKCGTSGMPKP